MRAGSPTRPFVPYALAVALLAACAEIPSGPMPLDLATVQAGYGRAFGSVEYVEDGRSWDNTAPGSGQLTLFVRAARSGEMHQMDIERDGHFVWGLKPDDYAILGFRAARATSPGTQTSTGRIMATFAIAEAGQAVYVGQLRIRMARGRYDFGVEDRYDAGDLSRFEAQLDAGRFRAVRGLMGLEPRVGSYTRVTGICAGGWGITCTKELQGVEPLSPPGAANGFPVGPILTPLLEWKRSSRSDVTYDVVVYESHSLFPLPGPSAHSHRMRGALVAYKEGLAEPRFAPTSGLQRGRTYEWSVRVRDGEAVSSWSTTSYSVEILIAGSRGSGHYFGFATPQ